MTEFSKVSDHQPPISTDDARVWLHLYLPDRLKNGLKTSAIRVGLYVGSGNFRMAGESTNTLERVGSWKYLTGREVVVDRPRVIGYG